MAQFLRPNADITSGANWSRSTGLFFWDCINEVVADAGDFVQCSATNQALEVRLSSVTDPNSSTGHIVRVLARSVGSGAAEAHTILLVQGTTTIATVVSGNLTRNTYTTITYTLTAAQANAITNYGDLRLRFTCTNLAAGESYQIGWAEMEVPDAARRVFIIA